MHPDLPSQALAAVATLVAALIAGAISFVNLTLTKELKTSEFRQAWIDGLRDDLAKFFGAARAFAREVQTFHDLGPGQPGDGHLRLSEDKVSDLRYQAAETFSRIKLRLNPDEPEHKELARLLQRAVDEQNTMLKTGAEPTATFAAIEAATVYAQPVLKKEWMRVKQGELPFRVARNWIAPFVVIASVGLLMFIWKGTFRP